MKKTLPKRQLPPEVLAEILSRPRIISPKTRKEVIADLRQVLKSASTPQKHLD